jgi:hypothetical protein
MDRGAEDSSLVVFAGQSEYDPTKGEKPQAIVGCVNLAYHLTPVAQYKFADPKYFSANSIKRIRPSTNEFLVGVNQAIKVLYLDFNAFREITSFELCHSGSFQ